MKSMKFGQKSDSRRPSQQLGFQNLLEGSSSTGVFGESQSTVALPMSTGHVEDVRSRSNFQALQSSRNLALLQTMTGAHQQQLQRLQQRQRLTGVAELLASQSAALGALNAGHEIDRQIRDGLLFMGLPATIQSLQQGMPSAYQTFQNHPSASQQSFSTTWQANQASINAIDRELRSALLLSSALPLSAGGQHMVSASSALQREDSVVAAAAVALDSSRQSPAVVAAGMMPHLNFDSGRLLMGNSGAGSTSRHSNHSENPAGHASLLPATQMTNQLGTQLRLLQHEGLTHQLGLSSHELWLLLQEHERQRMQDEHERRWRQNEHDGGHR
jgi:hypothetical protein